MVKPILGACSVSIVLAVAASAQGLAGPEFRVNTYTTGIQDLPVIAADATGNFVVVWDGPDGSSRGVFGRRFSAAGTPRGAEFRVNTYTTNDQAGPSVASDSNGNFVVTWTSVGQDGSSFGVFGQQFDAAGAPAGAEFRVNTFTPSHQLTGRVAMEATSGNFVVVWNGDGPGYGYFDMFGQRFSAAGVPLGAEFQINTYTTNNQIYGAVALDAAGNFVVVWGSSEQDGYYFGVYGQRFSAAGTPLGAEFRVNTHTANEQLRPSVAWDGSGNFMVVWVSCCQDGSNYGVFGQRFDAVGSPVGPEFRVNTYTTNNQAGPSIASDPSGHFVVVWSSAGQDGSGDGAYAQRLDAAGAPVGTEFRVNTYTPDRQTWPAVASGPGGTFVVTWQSRGQDGSDWGVFAQRFGGLEPTALAVDATALPTSNGNRVFEPGETVAVTPSWQNVSGAAQTFGGTVGAFTGPGTPGDPVYSVVDGTASYGTVPDGGSTSCTSTADCYVLGMSVPATRPVGHWDAMVREDISPPIPGESKDWALHVGDSFADVSRSSGFYRFIETLLHHDITGGCTPTAYCPISHTSREQMAVFVLVGKEGSGYFPPACGSGSEMFADVPGTSPFCRWIEELARRGVVTGCGSGNYCPTVSVSREQMAVFVLRTLDPALGPPACAPPNIFGDVPETSPFCRWVEELANRGVVTGCGGGHYCPTAPVTREQMGVFITATFRLTLYGP